MQLKEIDRNKIAEHKIRLKKHKKAIENDVSNSNVLSKEVMTQEKTVNDNGVIKKKTAKKKIIDKKAMNDRHKAIAEKLMDDVREGNINIGRNLKEYPEESKVVITKEERADRFKRLHTMVQDMMKKRNE